MPLIVATAATLAVSAVTPAPAEASGFGTGLAGGLIAGALIGGIASSTYGYGPGYGYSGGGYAPVYYGRYAPAYYGGCALYNGYGDGYRRMYQAHAYYVGQRYYEVGTEAGVTTGNPSDKLEGSVSIKTRPRFQIGAFFELDQLGGDYHARRERTLGHQAISNGSSFWQGDCCRLDGHQVWVFHGARR